MILDTILDEKRRDLAQRKAAIPMDEIKARAADAPKPAGFALALSKKENGIPAVIAEVKKASPSKGVIRPSFDPVSIAKSYEAAGASAISVLTDEKFFEGSLDYLAMVKQAVSLPVIRKDFILDEYQVYEARAAGADAVLLIISALDKDKLSSLMECVAALGMDALVEVHEEDEMHTALNAGATLIGINNRNLYTFEVTLDTTAGLLPIARENRRISNGTEFQADDAPAASRKIVSESGIFTRRDIEMLGWMGVDAVLIGEAFMREQNIEAKLREMIK